MPEAQPMLAAAVKSPHLRNATAVFLVGNIVEAIDWYRRLGFTAEYFPPGFAILRRDAIQIFLQHHDNYIRPHDPAARERGAWDIHIETDDVAGLCQALSAEPEVRITRALCCQDYGQTDFEVTDPYGYVLVFGQAAAT